MDCERWSEKRRRSGVGLRIWMGDRSRMRMRITAGTAYASITRVTLPLSETRQKCAHACFRIHSLAPQLVRHHYNVTCPPRDNPALIRAQTDPDVRPTTLTAQWPDSSRRGTSEKDCTPIRSQGTQGTSSFEGPSRSRRGRRRPPIDIDI